MNANEKTETLLEVIERLCGVLVHENTSLEARKFREIGTTIEEKDRLCKAFELLVKGITKDGPDYVAKSDNELRKTLNEHGKQLKSLIDDNCAALQTAIQANDRIMQAVRKAAIKCTPKASNYTHSGKLTDGARVDAKAPTPVTINQIL